MIHENRLSEWFTLRPPSDEDLSAFAEINADAERLAKTILENTPPSPDQSTSIRKIREAVQAAQQSRLYR